MQLSQLLQFAQFLQSSQCLQSLQSMQSVPSVQFLQFKQSAQFLQFTQLVQLMLPFSSATMLMLVEALWFVMAFSPISWWAQPCPNDGLHAEALTKTVVAPRCVTCNINHIIKGVKGYFNFFREKENPLISQGASTLCRSGYVMIQPLTALWSK